jgi:methionyl-tRNA synthetase
MPATLLFLLLILWVIPWKAVALWKAARNGHKIWFIAIFILNTLAILEIIYIFYFSSRKSNLIIRNEADQGN